MTTAIESAVLSEIFPRPPQAPKPMPFIPDWLDDYGLTTQEFRVYCYVVKRASINGKCDESVPVIAKRCPQSGIAYNCRVARNVVLAALQNLSTSIELVLCCQFIHERWNWDLRFIPAIRPDKISLDDQLQGILSGCFRPLKRFLAVTHILSVCLFYFTVHENWKHLTPDVDRLSPEMIEEHTEEATSFILAGVKQSH